MEKLRGAGCLEPEGRDTPLPTLRDEPYAGVPLRALMVERLAMLPADGRGIDRGIVNLEDEPVIPPVGDVDPRYDRMLFCDGRGRLRFIAI